MKKPGNKVIAVYLAWVLIHFTLWVIAKPGVHNTKGFYPFALKLGYYNRVVEKPFTIDRVYDITEFMFYAIAPILIYYIITLFKSKDQTPQ